MSTIMDFQSFTNLIPSYIALNVKERRPLRTPPSVGNFWTKGPLMLNGIIESKALLLDKHDISSSQLPAPVKALARVCVTCGGAHSYRNCPATDSNNYRDNIQEYVSQAAAANFNQGNSGYRPPPMANQIRPPGFPPMQHNSQANNQNRLEPNQTVEWLQPGSNSTTPVPPAPGVSKPDFDNYVKANDAVMQNMQNQMANITDLITKFVNSNTASTSGSGSLPSNTIANPKGDVKAITTRSGVPIIGLKISLLLKK
ncbi:hypothetical protein Tco_0874077 [Tanacetum coccineum]|uniref:Reverse transcriptase domain-containing protein n=1 Tax=Tanacetum coccineum TaxID=301880 RepID=A0ABQ5BKZ4_9ASTR